jgi:hypothetical protein
VGAACSLSPNLGDRCRRQLSRAKCDRFDLDVRTARQ